MDIDEELPSDPAPLLEAAGIWSQKLQVVCKGKKGQLLPGHNASVGTMKVLCMCAEHKKNDAPFVLQLEDWVNDHCGSALVGGDTVTDEDEDAHYMEVVKVHAPGKPEHNKSLRRHCCDLAQSLGGAALAGQHVWIYWWEQPHDDVDVQKALPVKLAELRGTSKAEDQGVWYDSEVIAYDEETGQFTIFYKTDGSVADVLMDLNFLHWGSGCPSLDRRSFKARPDPVQCMESPSHDEERCDMPPQDTLDDTMDVDSEDMVVADRQRSGKAGPSGASTGPSKAKQGGKPEGAGSGATATTGQAIKRPQRDSTMTAIPTKGKKDDAQADVRLEADEAAKAAKQGPNQPGVAVGAAGTAPAAAAGAKHGKQSGVAVGWGGNAAPPAAVKPAAAGAPLKPVDVNKQGNAAPELTRGPGAVTTTKPGAGKATETDYVAAPQEQRANSASTSELTLSSETECGAGNQGGMMVADSATTAPASAAAAPTREPGKGVTQEPAVVGKSPAPTQPPLVSAPLTAQQVKISELSGRSWDSMHAHAQSLAALLQGNWQHMMQLELELGMLCSAAAAANGAVPVTGQHAAWELKACPLEPGRVMQSRLSGEQCVAAAQQVQDALVGKARQQQGTQVTQEFLGVAGAGEWPYILHKATGPFTPRPAAERVFYVAHSQQQPHDSTAAAAASTEPGSTAQPCFQISLHRIPHQANALKRTLVSAPSSAAPPTPAATSQGGKAAPPSTTSIGAGVKKVSLQPAGTGPSQAAPSATNLPQANQPAPAPAAPEASAPPADAPVIPQVDPVERTCVITGDWQLDLLGLSHAGKAKAGASAMETDQGQASATQHGPDSASFLRVQRSLGTRHVSLRLTWFKPSDWQVLADVAQAGLSPACTALAGGLLHVGSLVLGLVGASPTALEQGSAEQFAERLLGCLQACTEHVSHTRSAT